MGNVDSACGFSEREELLHQIDMIEAPAPGVLFCRALLLLAHCVAVRYCRLSSLMKLPMQRAFRRQSIHPAIG